MRVLVFSITTKQKIIFESTEFFIYSEKRIITNML